jgi:outer membrane protein assembly factor BamB
VCLDAATGHIIWMYPTAMSVPAEPAIDGDLVYFGSWSHSIYAFDKKTGAIVWKENGVGLDSGTLIATGGEVYLPHHNTVFSALDQCEDIRPTVHSRNARKVSCSQASGRGL